MRTATFQFAESGSSVNGPNLFTFHCLSCRNPHQTLIHWIACPPFHWKSLLFTEKCFIASPSQKSALTKIEADFWEGDATKHFSVKKRGSPWKGGRFGKDFYRKSNSVKRSGPIQWTGGLWRLKSCCPHPLPENRLWLKGATSKNVKNRQP